MKIVSTISRETASSSIFESHDLLFPFQRANQLTMNKLVRATICMKSWKMSWRFSASVDETWTSWRRPRFSSNKRRTQKKSSSGSMPKDSVRKPSKAWRVSQEIKSLLWTKKHWRIIVELKKADDWHHSWPFREMCLGWDLSNFVVLIFSDSWNMFAFQYKTARSSELMSILAKVRQKTDVPADNNNMTTTDTMKV